MRSPAPSPAHKLSRGVSLIEIMVGLAIALVSTLVIFQVFAASNASNLSTASGNEAQISGNLGLFQLERDLKVAGMGFGTLTKMSAAGVDPCRVQTIIPALTPSFPLVPVLITPGEGAVPDKIDVLWGNSAYLTGGRRYSAGTGTSKTASSSRAGIQPGDLAIVTDTGTPPTACELVEITGNSNGDGLTVEHEPGASYINFYSGAKVPATRNSAGTPAALDGPGNLYSLGPQPVLSQWRVADNSLNVSNLLGAGTVSAVAEGIVNLKAEYGVDDGGAAVAGDRMKWTANRPDNWSQVLAVRFALLARSQQYEKTAVKKTAVTTVKPCWGNCDTAHTFTMFNVDGTADSTPDNANDWRHYRYRVYESVVAMRNMIWGTSP
jgi:type IV pilus assembly protein PilW